MCSILYLRNQEIIFNPSYIYVCIYIDIVYMYTGLAGWLLKTDLSTDPRIVKFKP